jgi:hypothetical protein
MTRLAAIVVVFLVASPALSQAICMPRKNVVGVLGKGHGEAVVLRAIDTGNKMVEVWVSREKGTFTIVLTDAVTKLSCMVSTGGSVQFIDPPKKGEKT